jgi:hypothetical protein
VVLTQIGRTAMGLINLGVVVLFVGLTWGLLWLCEHL